LSNFKGNRRRPFSVSNPPSVQQAGSFRILAWQWTELAQVIAGVRHQV